MKGKEHAPRSVWGESRPSLTLQQCLSSLMVWENVYVRYTENIGRRNIFKTVLESRILAVLVGVTSGRQPTKAGVFLEETYQTCVGYHTWCEVGCLLLGASCVE